MKAQFEIRKFFLSIQRRMRNMNFRRILIINEIWIIVRQIFINEIMLLETYILPHKIIVIFCIEKYHRKYWAKCINKRCCVFDLLLLQRFQTFYSSTLPLYNSSIQTTLSNEHWRNMYIPLIPHRKYIQQSCVHSRTLCINIWQFLCMFCSIILPSFDVYILQYYIKAWFSVSIDTRNAKNILLKQFQKS